MGWFGQLALTKFVRKQFLDIDSSWDVLHKTGKIDFEKDGVHDDWHSTRMNHVYLFLEFKSRSSFG